MPDMRSAHTVVLLLEAVVVPSFLAHEDTSEEVVVEDLTPGGTYPAWYDRVEKNSLFPISSVPM